MMRLNEDIHNCKYKPKDLANFSGINIRTLQRYFKVTFNMTPTEYFRKLRLEKAKEELEKGFKVKEVAIAFHFKQLSHFSRDFKKFHGINPSEIKKVLP